MDKYEIIIEDDDGEIHVLYMDVKDITIIDDAVGIMDTDGDFHVMFKKNLTTMRRIP